MNSSIVVIDRQHTYVYIVVNYGTKTATMNGEKYKNYRKP